MASSKYRIDFANAVTVALGAGSATAALPANSQLVGVSTTGNCHFRISAAAQATAILTDPLLTPNSEIQILRLDGTDTNISAIQDATTPNTGVLSCFRVFEY